MTGLLSDELTMLVPDFPFDYAEWLRHPAGIGWLPAERAGSEVAVIGGGIAGLVAAYELMRLGLRPVVYEAARLGGRICSAEFPGHPGVTAELGAMRFAPSATTLFHYIEQAGLPTKPFPNPFAPCTSSTLVNLKGSSHFARRFADLPVMYKEVADSWNKTLCEQAELMVIDDAIRRRDTAAIKSIWNRLVCRLDDQSLYGFLAASSSFSSFSHREIFGQVGFGNGGWDSDFPNSVLEVLRIISTGAHDGHRRIVGGCQRLPDAIWELAPRSLAHWPAETSLASLHKDFSPKPAVTRLRRDGTGIAVSDEDGATKVFPAVVFTAQLGILLSRIDCDESLLSSPHWTAVERTHYMGASKLFVVADRPFWLDRDPVTGRDTMSMTLTDRLPRGVYLFDNGPGKAGVMCLSYTYNDDSLKFATLTDDERLDVVLNSLRQIYPGVDIRAHIVGPPISVTWEAEPHFMGAFKQNLPGHYRYQRRLFTHFMDSSPGLFIAGDDVSWIGGFAEGAVTTALNAVWGVLRYLGGATPAGNPGPGDVFGSIAPLELPDDT
jgi:tryptophan 2-monooxygenase